MLVGHAQALSRERTGVTVVVPPLLPARAGVAVVNGVGELTAKLGDCFLHFGWRPLAQLAPNGFEFLGQFGVVVGQYAAHVVFAEVLLGERAFFEGVEKGDGPRPTAAEHADNFGAKARRQLGPVGQESGRNIVTVEGAE